MSVSIPTPLLSKDELSRKITKVPTSIPEHSKDFNEKTRAMQIIIRNKTQFHIYYKGDHFDSGKYLSNPLSVEPFQQMAYCVSNKDNATTGVSGGSAFTLKLSENDSWNFAVGWTNPLVGAYKTSLLESESAKAAYDAADNKAVQLTSKSIFTGTTEEGENLRFQLYASTAPAQDMVVEILQIYKD